MPTMEKTQTEAPRAEVGKKRKQVAQNRLPSKRSINLAQVDVKRINWYAAAPALLLVCVLAFAFGKFAVADRFAAAAEARSEVERMHRQIDEGYAAIEAFGDINDRFAHYTYSGMTEEELSRVDRVEVMELLRRGVLSRMGLDSWSVSGNELTLSVSGKTLAEINNMMQSLLAEDMVDYCTVSTAQTSSEGASDGAPQGDTVSAIVIVYLKNNQGEATNG